MSGSGFYVDEVAVYLNGISAWVKADGWTHIALTQTRKGLRLARLQLFVDGAEVVSYVRPSWWRRTWAAIRRWGRR